MIFCLTNTQYSDTIAFVAGKQPKVAAIAQAVVRILGKDEVTSSSLVSSSKKARKHIVCGLCYFLSHVGFVDLDLDPVCLPLQFQPFQLSVTGFHLCLSLGKMLSYHIAAFA